MKIEELTEAWLVEVYIKKDSMIWKRISEGISCAPFNERKMTDFDKITGYWKGEMVKTHKQLDAVLSELLGSERYG
jgi:hypothetical protein